MGLDRVLAPNAEARQGRMALPFERAYFDLVVTLLLRLLCCLEQVWHGRIYQRPGTRWTMETVAALVQIFDLPGYHGYLWQWLRPKTKLLRQQQLTQAVCRTCHDLRHRLRQWI